MKRIIAIALLLSFTNCLSAQTTAEWLRQKATQKKYLLQQIAALQVYTGYVARGYSVAKKGLVTIHHLKDGDFNLHKNHFGSLAMVNPAISRYARVAGIISLGTNMLGQAAALRKFCNQSGELTSQEVLYVKTVLGRLLHDCSTTLDRLFTVISSDRLSMTDDERIILIDELYESMLDMQAFSHAFTNTTRGLCLQRTHDQHDVLVSEKLNNLK